MKKQITLMDRPRMLRALHRMALQVWEQLQADDQLVIIGLNERGFATAKELADTLNKVMDSNIPVHRYEVAGNPSETPLPDCNDKFVLLVDDVIFSGKTMFDALSDLCDIYEPNVIELAVLLDRGHRRYPLLTELCGISVPTKQGEHIEVMLQDGMLKEAILFKNR
ncbi:phosphoribosyltransferase family protein [Gracilimonas mengyeensis]|uniref:Pyrimidine operon attenuation protein / uracil phosphoribosyltransferase n=1 Tax=Gracilimonas mengyeensis TaxID=1302730 RepID=A0A521E230_9BACT|nr:phosphoribosyltransferase family protein [Gracilimonas mengyeensis]SMO77942.1 pyrimidine operon attenuation protein / uracil phosphoribosyltransferase [Gracilimonas mengyeensis]